MNRQRILSISRARPLRRLFVVAAASLLAIAASVAIVALAIPSLARADPASRVPITTYLVDKDATGAQTGETWEDAFTSIQDALDAATGGEIWVAEGIYYPDEGLSQTDGDRSSTFQLKQGIAIYGGFEGTENLLEQRDWVNNVTVLSGDLDQNDITDPNGIVTETAKIVGTDNAYHVVTGDDEPLAAQIDGFVITAGLADSTTDTGNQRGAGIHNDLGSPTLANLIVQGNKAAGGLLGTPSGYGGGMYNEDGGPETSNVTFRNNYAQVSGGGLYTTQSTGPIADIAFEGNVAGSRGGGMYLSTTAGHNLSNLTFTGNSAAEHGGGLYVQSGVLSFLDDSLLAGNTAVRGAGIYIHQSVLSLNGVEVSANVASDVGGGIFAQLGQYTLTDVTFDGNQADTAGGGIYDNKNYSTLNAVTFVNNASALGAGMYVDDELFRYANLLMSTAEFENNTASQNGGGLYIANSPRGTLDAIAFLDNRAVSGSGGGMFMLNSSGYQLSSTSFDGNEAVSGGGMFVEASSPSLVDVGFAGNEAQLTYVNDSLGGGGIYLAGSSNAILSDCSFSANSAATGGGMFIDGSSPTLTNVSFSGNLAGDGVSGSGGGLWNNGGSPALTNVLFSGNASTLHGGGMYSSGAASSAALVNATFSGNGAGGTGGGLYSASPDLTIDNSVFWNNKDASGVGTVDASIWDDPDAVVSHSLIQGQLPAGTGNLDGIDPNNDPLFVSPVDPNGAPSTSGILSVKHGSPIVDVGDNTVIPAGVTVDLAGNARIFNAIVDMGAYELPLACPPPDTPRLYVDHTANGNNTGASWLDAFVNLRDAFTLAGNCAGIVEVWVAEGVYRPDAGVGMVPDDRSETYQLIDGVAVYGGFNGTETLLEERDWSGQITVLSGDIDTNDISSGGIVLDPGNIVGANSYHVTTGGGSGNTAILDGFVITAGQANDITVDQANRGAGMYNDGSSPTLTNLSFVGNFAVEGAGVANLNGGNPPMTNVQFQSNTAVSFGGAMLNVDSSPMLFSAHFSSNTAGSLGGAIYNEGSDPSLTNVSLRGNTADSFGGAIYNQDSHPSLTNALLSGNSASMGAAIYNTGSSPTLVNITVAGNHASDTAGGMLNTDTSLPAIHNCIFWSNQDSSGTGTASATIDNDDPGSIPLINYCLVQALSGVEHTGDHNLDLDPRFAAPVDPADAPTTTGDYTLGVFSPAIDVGDNSANSTLTDLAGDPRIINSIIDLGAYEAPYRAVHRIYLPTILRSYP